MTTMLTPPSFVVVGDLLEDTITRTAKTQNGADCELAWLRKRLDNERRDPRTRSKASLERGDGSSSGGGSDTKTMAQSTTMNVPPADKENAAAEKHGGHGAKEAGSIDCVTPQVSPTDMSVLQLRRFLRAVGQPTVGLKPALTARLERALSSGAVEAFVDSARAQPRAGVECAGERRKTESMLAMAESMLNLDSGATATGTATTTAAAPAPSANTTTAPKLPLRESLSSANNERSSRSSAGSGADKALKQVRQAPATPAPATSKLLSGQQQDAVVAKIRSAAKRSASPEKKLPYQDDDTPNTKGARLKKEMEDRLARQKAVQKQQQQPAPATPSAEAEALPTPVTPPSVRPPVPSSPAPMPPPSPPRAGSPPPPPTADAPRPADLAKSGNTPTAADKTSGGDHAAAVPASPSSAAPVPAGSTKKDVTANAAAVDAVVDGVATLSVDGGDGQAAVESRVVGGGDGGASSGVAPAEKPAAASKFGSPGRHRAPTAKTPTRKANPFAKDSISAPGPSGLKAAAHKAFHRVGGKPAPPTPDVPSPTGSTTQDAFAKFRAMDSNSKKGGASVPSFKARPSPSPKGPSSSARQTPSAGNAASGQMLPPQRLDFGVSKSSNSTTTPSYSSKRTGDATTDSGGGDAEPSAAKSRADAAAKAADEARRDAQARAEQKTREAAMKAAAEREEKARKEEERKKKDAERKKQAGRRAAERLAERAAAAEALRKAEEKKKAEKRAALEEKAAAAAAAARERAEAAARKAEEEEADAAAELKRVADAEAAAGAAATAAAKPVKPPTPPRTAAKPPPTPPRPGHKGQAQGQAPPPPTPPRPAAAAASAAQVPPASPWTPSKPAGASGAGGAAEARAVALAKKKEEIAKRMEEIRNKKTKGATPASAAPSLAAVKPPAAAPQPAPVPTPAPAPAPAPAPVKSTPPATETTEERESYDAYDVEPDESGSESGEEEEEAAPEIQEPKEANDKSAIPDWARGKALAKILDKQYGGRNPLNPDKIFPEFFTCNLEHIFNTKKQKWDRSSSGNWHTDRLTIAEKLAYQRAMGFDK